MDSGLRTLSPHKPTATKSPWGSPMPAAPTCSLASVMDEELARSFQAEEEKLLKYSCARDVCACACIVCNGCGLGHIVSLWFF